MISIGARIKFGLIVAGGLGGGLIGVAMTIVGKIVAKAPPATPSNYLWNAVFFGVIGACVGPIATLSALRRVPLWRTVAEPVAGAAAGGALGLALGSGILFLMLVPVGAGAAIYRLTVAYRDPSETARTAAILPRKS